MPIVIIVMGVSGSGKTTVGTLLARDLGWAFQDADSFHSQANIAKMSQGVALTDDDRRPWLASMRSAISGWLARDQKTVLACSALKGSYRSTLQGDDVDKVRFLYLNGSPELILNRLEGRESHFMKAEMLESQLKTLEEPKGAMVVDAALTPPEIVHEARRRLGI